MGPVMSDQRYRRGIYVLLWASLAVNVFLVGLLGSQLRAGTPREHRHQGTWLERVADALPSPDRERMQGLLQRRQADLSQRKAALAEAREAVRQALSTEPFDPGALTTAFARMREARGAMQEYGHTILIEVAPQLSADGRKVIADWDRQKH